MCYKCKLYVDISVVFLFGLEWFLYRDYFMDMCFIYVLYVLLDLLVFVVRFILCT